MSGTGGTSGVFPLFFAWQPEISAASHLMPPCCTGRAYLRGDRPKAEDILTPEATDYQEKRYIRGSPSRGRPEGGDWRGCSIKHLMSIMENKQTGQERPTDVQAGVPGVFFQGETHDAEEFLTGLVRKARESVLLIDNRIPVEAVGLLERRNEGVKAEIWTESHYPRLRKALKQSPGIEARHCLRALGSFLVIDREEIYLLGAPLSELGKVTVAVIRLEIPASVIARFSLSDGGCLAFDGNGIY